MRTGGWCPAGGLAEDFPTAPGLLCGYPELTETPSVDPDQRTEWNVRDSHITIVIRPDLTEDVTSPGTTTTFTMVSRYNRPIELLGDRDLRSVCEKLPRHGYGLTLNIAGPRESEWSGAYETSKRLVNELLRFSATGRVSGRKRGTGAGEW